MKIHTLVAVFSIGIASMVQATELGDPELGAKAYRKCIACHRVGQGAKHRVGPHLNGIFGRTVGELEDYKYSDAMKHMGVEGMVWTAENLDAFLVKPKAVIRGTKMNFKGISDAGERSNLLAYLRQFSDNPANIPEAQPTAEAPEVALSPEILAIVGDRDYGEYLASECLTCHKADGTSEGIPAITGWPEEDFVIAMHAYKQKIRTNPVMQMMSGALSEEEIAALAAYFKTLE